MLLVEFAKSLNPCFNGRCTRTPTPSPFRLGYRVLILVLMEDALVLIIHTYIVYIHYNVLILVLMEDALVPPQHLYDTI